MQTHVYSLDLRSYKLFTPVHRLTDVIIIRGGFDTPADNDEITVDRQYTRTLRVNADDLSQSIPGQPAALLTAEGATRIVKFIEQAVADSHDLVVHCFAGASRTGAVVQLTMFNYHLPLTHVQLWRALRATKSKVEEVTTKADFERLYQPNPLWTRLLQQAYAKYHDEA
ncbi:protein-tyrosine phosphatase family protein [Lacticaseibacillus zhaodongensis]|uniref:protein-tyrosine phosphatase family protein n=1 Tax=Lacticaseibacillus zhaodongensis TaxID=2668065 RepID=UPI0012D34299|nr:protein-tyrosine phosphatase family protein [Lacticaseibacillus zhaodongensis]